MEKKMIADKIIGRIEDFEDSGLRIDSVVLDHYDMAKPHQKLVSREGTVIGLSLSHGEHLYCGAVIYRDEEKIIAADLQPEDALDIRPEGNIQWAMAAFNIGNMHQSAYLYEDRILVPYDPIMENLIKNIGVAYTRCTCKLDGQRAGLAADHSHSQHGHMHSHGDHAHVHNHSCEEHFHSREEG